MTLFSVIPEAAKPLSGSRLERRSHTSNFARLLAEAWRERPSGRETCLHYPVIPDAGRPARGRGTRAEEPTAPTDLLTT